MALSLCKPLLMQAAKKKTLTTLIIATTAYRMQLNYSRTWPPLPTLPESKANSEVQHYNLLKS